MKKYVAFGIILCKRKGEFATDIVYRQKNAQFSVFKSFGLSDCYFKHLFPADTRNNNYKKLHHHTAFEIHIMVRGFQFYHIGGQELEICSGEFLIIPPGIVHYSAKSSDDAEKYTLTFEINKSGLKKEFLFDFSGSHARAKTPRGVLENIEFLCSHTDMRDGIFCTVAENRVFETVIAMFCAAGIYSPQSTQETECRDPRMEAVKEYIANNINTPISVEKAAAHCYLSKKQLTRLFEKYHGTTPAKYIKQCKIDRICGLLKNTSLSLREISESMNFSNEYYFNYFFKKNCGMPPSAYRKMHNK